MTCPSALSAVVANPWLSDTVVVRETVVEAPRVTTYRLAFADERRADAFTFRPGQFGMLYMPGVGESPIGISGLIDAHRRPRAGRF